MAKIGRTCKEYMIKELSETLKRAPNLFITDCTGLSVSDLERLRSHLKNAKASYLVVKNSLGKFALKNVKWEALTPLVEGTIGLAQGADAILTSKALMKFSKDSGKLKIKGGMVDGKVVSESEIKEISLLPSREALLSRLCGGMKAPIAGFVNVLQGTINKFVYAIDAIKRKKGGSE